MGESTLSALGAARDVSRCTFRRDGSAAEAPVWIVRPDDLLVSGVSGHVRERVVLEIAIL